MMGLSIGVRLLLVLAATLVAVIVGMLAGLLAYLDSSRLPAVITRGGAAAGVSLTLLLLMLSSLGVLG
ncbi:MULTISPECIES: hypothetical protein [unclassified Streptomyces]|uniref:hypothetical protein n=1 Tax=unclassified Streptomyces TaxID=2593676 RepID=UPI0022AF68F3|nr:MULTISPECIES: hypothetical protein [unclassified Streptomyces]MCZ4097296.1 hypothetical protein [Streptomyces sp. H39-C1]MCZ4120600.1 hypothetical protein [Streptomyces sp. H39-S7]